MGARGGEERGGEEEEQRGEARRVAVAVAVLQFQVGMGVASFGPAVALRRASGKRCRMPFYFARSFSTFGRGGAMIHLD